MSPGHLAPNLGPHYLAHICKRTHCFRCHHLHTDLCTEFLVLALSEAESQIGRSPKYHRTQLDLLAVWRRANISIDFHFWNPIFQNSLFQKAAIWLSNTPVTILKCNVIFNRDGITSYPKNIRSNISTTLLSITCCHHKKCPNQSQSQFCHYWIFFINWSRYIWIACFQNLWTTWITLVRNYQ